MPSNQQNSFASNEHHIHTQIHIGPHKLLKSLATITESEISFTLQHHTNQHDNFRYNEYQFTHKSNTSPQHIANYWKLQQYQKMFYSREKYLQANITTMNTTVTHRSIQVHTNYW